MKHLGDITKISGYDAPPVDVIIGGSPCQDLSVAGKRAGLNGERSGLFMEQIRIIKEMREASAKNGADEIKPRYMVWENVIGVFSSNGCEDFRAVLEETVRVVDERAIIPRPPRGKWQTCGCIVGNGYSLAWRVLDAQFWGVPQRRRRIALIADFGGGSAPEILFIRKSVCGSASTSEETRKGTAAAVKKDVGEAIGFNYLMGSKAGSVGAAIEQSGTLKAGCDDAAVCFDITHANDVIRECGEISPTPQNRMGTGGNQVPICYAIDRAAFNQGGNAKYKPNISADGISQTLVSKGPGAVCFCIQGNSIDRADTAGCNGKGVKEDISYTLNTIDRHAVCYGVPLNFRPENMRPQEEIAPTLCNGTAPGTHNGVINNYRVRRLTPLECERLQGFPDGWTDIGEWTDGKGKKYDSSDSTRYKALGNSIALPPWRWVLKRLCACYERNATLASLFDGIGGFPLIWEQLNGKGSCLWASEIEEFPIAVTKLHFGN